MKKRKKEDKLVIYHQHHDEQGNIFGAPHPINAIHENKNTQKYHELSIETPIKK